MSFQDLPRQQDPAEPAVTPPIPEQIAQRFAMLAMAEQQQREERLRHLRRWMIYVPLGVAAAGFLWFSVASLRVIV